jgi:hypothetical protein
MKTPWLRLSVILSVGAVLLLSSCEYPYYPNGGYYGASNYQRSGTVLGGVNRSQFYTVRSSPAFASRPYYGRPYYASSHYQRPYYFSSYQRPAYRYTPLLTGYNHHPWGGYHGRCAPYSGWGTSGLGFGSRWF